MSDDRETAKTQPPTDILFTDVAGPVMYAEVADADGPAGYVWMATRVDARPRAGIVLLHPSLRAEPSEVLQDDLGETTLRLTNNADADAAEFLTYLAETRDGLGGKAIVADVRTAVNVDGVRRLAGWQT